jgi:hypothetical protein
MNLTHHARKRIRQRYGFLVAKGIREEEIADNLYGTAEVIRGQDRDAETTLRATDGTVLVVVYKNDGPLLVSVFRRHQPPSLDSLRALKERFAR